MNIIALAALVAIQGSGAEATPHDDANCIGYEELRSGQESAALNAIERSDFSKSDPAVLINEGIALARLGDYDAARVRFEAVMAHEERMRLETAGGEWVDSRWLAKRGLAMLGNGDFQRYVAMNGQ